MKLSFHLMFLLATISANGQTLDTLIRASVILDNQDYTGIDWQVRDSTRYYYQSNGDYSITETFCPIVSTDLKKCQRIEYYNAPDTTMVTLYDYDPATQGMVYNWCQFNRTDSQGRTVETGNCYNPSGNNGGHYRNYYTFDSLGRLKQDRKATWSAAQQRLVNSSITDYFYDTLGYAQYFHTQSYSGGSFYLSSITHDSIDVNNKTTTRIILSKPDPIANWDTLQRRTEWKDTSGAVITSVVTIQVDANGQLTNYFKDSSLYNSSTFIREHFRYEWNDTLQLWQAILRQYSELNSFGNAVHSMFYQAPSLGLSLILISEANTDFDTSNRRTYHHFTGYDFSTGIRNFEVEYWYEYDIVSGDSTVDITNSFEQHWDNGYTITTKFESYTDSLDRPVESRKYLFDDNIQDWWFSEWRYNYYNEDALVGIGTATGIAAQSVNVYPNPSAGFASISFTSPSPSAGKLIIYDLAGKIVHTESIKTINGPNHHYINLMETVGNNAGVYLISLRIGNQQYHGKVVYQP